MSSFADKYYWTPEWRNVRAEYMKKVGGLCERCYARGYITPAKEVHHIKPLTVRSIKDPAQRSDYKNLMALCERCHDEVHAEMKRKKRDEPRRFEVGANGEIKICEGAPHLEQK